MTHRIMSQTGFPNVQYTACGKPLAKGQGPPPSQHACMRQRIRETSLSTIHVDNHTACGEPLPRGGGPPPSQHAVYETAFMRDQSVDRPCR